MMIKVDYIVVGCGLAGIAFCEVLRQNGRSYVVFDDATQQSSKTAGGLVNPVVLKRFTPVWNSQELWPSSILSYHEIEKNLNKKFINSTSIKRVFNSIEEQNDWTTASDKPILSRFISDNIQRNTNPSINADFGMGEVKETYRIDTKILIDEYLMALDREDKLKRETFNYEDLSVSDNYVSYQDVNADHIVFADGFGMKKNRYFNYLPLLGSKGEYLVIRSPKLQLDHVIKGPVFIIPIGVDKYLVGATYNNQDKSNTTTSGARDELVIKLGRMINCDYDVIGQRASVRPTVKDRRPLVGRHPKFNRLLLLNGLGTRGIVLSPYLAKQLYDHIENSKEINTEVNVKRYEKLFLD